MFVLAAEEVNKSLLLHDCGVGTQLHQTLVCVAFLHHYLLGTACPALKDHLHISGNRIGDRLLPEQNILLFPDSSVCQIAGNKERNGQRVEE